MEENYISIERICSIHEIEAGFIEELANFRLITIYKEKYIHFDTLSRLEKMIVFSKEMHINVEGIDAIVNLLEQIDSLNDRINQLENRLSLFE